jgi:Neurotransmitter-gated ion-channel transmembrane region
VLTFPGIDHASLLRQGENEATRKCAKHGRQVREDWKYVAMVLDRLFLWIFTVAVLVRKKIDKTVGISNLIH